MDVHPRSKAFIATTSNTLGHPHADCKSVGLRLQWFESTTCHAGDATCLATLTFYTAKANGLRPSVVPVASATRRDGDVCCRPSKSYRLVYDGRFYALKAVVGIAHGLGAGGEYLKSRDFTGGYRGVCSRPYAVGVPRRLPMALCDFTGARRSNARTAGGVPVRRAVIGDCASTFRAAAVRLCVRLLLRRKSK